MNLKKITNDYRMNQWMGLIRERQESGQKINKFCDERGLSRNSYFYWQRKLRKAAFGELPQTAEPVVKTATEWVRLAKEVQIEETLNVEVNDCQIKVGMSTDPELVKKVCRILRLL